MIYYEVITCMLEYLFVVSALALLFTTLSCGLSRSLTSESHLVESHHHSTSQSQVMLETHPGTGHLSLVSLASHLGTQLITLS